MPDPSNPVLQNKPIDPRRLFRAIVDHFDMNGLRELCFECQTDFDNLREGGKKDKALHLVELFIQTNKITYLAAIFRELRPNIALENIVLVEEDEQLTLSNKFLSPKVNKENRSDTLIAGRSFTSLIRLLSKEEVRTAVVSFQTDFLASSQQINLLNDQKQLHDLFQSLEDCYYLVINDQKKLPQDEDAWINIEINEPELRSKINDLLGVSKRATFAADENRWIQHLDKAKQHIRVGVEDFNPKQLKLGTRLIFRTLNRQPTRINAQLVTAASSLRLKTLESALKTIATNLIESKIELDVVAEIQNGVDALAGLDDRLSDLVREHNAWQELDDEIRRIGTTGLNLAEDLEDAWIDIEPMIQGIIEGKTEKWAQNFGRDLALIQEAFQTRDPIKIRRLFIRLRSQMGRRFRQVDVELLTLCQDLQRVGESLDLLLRQFNK